MRIRNLAVTFALVVLTAVPVFASHGWSNYHWPRSTAEASIVIYRSLTATTYANWPDHLQKSVFGDPANPNTANRRGWNDSTVLALSISASGTDSTTRYNCTAPTGAIRVCNYAYGATGWAGLAQVWPDASGHIQRANTKVNDTYYTSNNDPWERHVMCQEVGHDFGLGHTSENGTSQNTCMDYYKNSTTNWTSTGPNQHDFDQLRVQHHASTMPADPANSFTDALRAGGPFDGEDLNAPWRWGTPIEWNLEGQPVTFILDRSPAPGDETITYVTWAPNAPGEQSETDSFDREKQQ